MRCLAFIWVSLLFCIYYINIYKYKMLYIAFWAIAACPWVPTLPKRFLFSVWISWWIHSCFCLMKANSCNMQELWPLNKNYCTCASSVMFPKMYLGHNRQHWTQRVPGAKLQHLVVLSMRISVIFRFCNICFFPSVL